MLNNASSKKYTIFNESHHREKSCNYLVGNVAVAVSPSTVFTFNFSRKHGKSSNSLAENYDSTEIHNVLHQCKQMKLVAILVATNQIQCIFNQHLLPVKL